MRAGRNGANKGSPGLPLARTGGRQRPGPPRHDPTRLAISDVSEGERAGIVVSRPHRRQPSRHAQDHDRRAGTQTDHCALALCHYWLATEGRRPSSSDVKRFTGTSIALSTIRRSYWPFSATAELRSEVARTRIRTWHLMPTRSEEHTSELQSHVNLVCRL